MLLTQMIVIQVITFACLVFILIRIINAASFAEVRRMKLLSDQAAQKTQELNEKITEAERLYKEKIDAAHKEASSIKLEAQEDSEKQKQTVLSNAKQEADRLLKQALNTKEKIKEEVEIQLQQKSLDQSIRLLAQVLNSRQMLLLHQIFVQEIIKDMEEIDVTRFKVDTGHGSLTMANQIEDAQAQKIAAILSSKTGKNIVLEPLVDPDLIAGMVVKLGNLVIDASLRGKLVEACEAFKK